MTTDSERALGHPARVAELHLNEETILLALTHAYNHGRLGYLHYSAAFDVTAARAAALSWHLTRDSDQSGEAGQTAKQAGPEGRERGPKASLETSSETPNE